MKRRLIIITVIIVAVICVGVATFLGTKNSPFALDAESYDAAQLQTIDLAELQSLIANQKSFGLFVSQPSCQASVDLQQHLDEFTTSHSLRFYEISFSNLKDSDIITELRFYPSFAIFHNGKVVDFLEANSDVDAPAYTSVDGFTDWFTKYVKLRI